MSWTYSGNPADSELDQLRYVLGDTNENAPLLSDQELDFELDTAASISAAAQSAGKVILSKLARQVAYSIGPEQVSANQRYEQYKDFLREFQVRLEASTAPLIAPEILDEGVTGIFDIGMFDNIRGDV